MGYFLLEKATRHSHHQSNHRNDILIDDCFPTGQHAILDDAQNRMENSSEMTKLIVTVTTNIVLQERIGRGSSMFGAPPSKNTSRTTPPVAPRGLLKGAQRGLHQHLCNYVDNRTIVLVDRSMYKKYSQWVSESLGLSGLQITRHPENLIHYSRKRYQLEQHLPSSTNYSNWELIMKYVIARYDVLQKGLVRMSVEEGRY